MSFFFFLLSLFLLVRPSFAEVSVLFDKTTHLLTIKEGEVVFFRVLGGYGAPGILPKERAGDFLTPEGIYEIVNLRPSGQYFYFAELNYPNLNDLAWAYFYGRIGLDDLKAYEQTGRASPNLKKILGNEIGIHGGGSFKLIKGSPDFNWTQGCIALSDEDMKRILPYLHIGTKVYLYQTAKSLYDLVKKLSYPKLVKPLVLWEGGLYFKKERGNSVWIHLKETYEGTKLLQIKEWTKGTLVIHLTSGPDGRLSDELERELKETLIKNIQTLEDPYNDRRLEEWK